MHAKWWLGRHGHALSRIVFAVCFSLTLYGLACGQGSENPTVSISMVAPVDDEVPMGTKVTLKAITNVGNPSWNWSRGCNGVTPWVHRFPWVVSQIDDCYGRPGNQTYRVFVNPLVIVPDLKAEKIVKFRAPDKATATIGDPQTPAGDPPLGGSSRTHQILQTKLTWNNKPLGPCSEVCFKETIRTVMEIDRFKQWVNFNIDLFPSNCVRTVYGNRRDTTEVTGIWQTSTLYDRVWHTWEHEQFTWLQEYQVGTVIARRQHKYQFSGNACDGFQWGPLLTEIRLKYVIGEAKDSAGNTVPLAGSNTPKNTQIAQWVIESQNP